MAEDLRDDERKEIDSAIRRARMQGWNDAIKAAEKAVTDAPVFPRKDYGGPAADGLRLEVIEACRKKVAALLKSDKQP